MEYHADPSAPAIGILDTKIHLNSVISDSEIGARYCVADIKDYYLNNQLAVFQYVRIHKKYFTDELRQEYDINTIADKDGYVYCRIEKGMYGLKEAGCVAFNKLKANLAPAGYSPVPCTPGLWRHKTKRTTFTLAVDDFGIKYFNDADLEHLLDALRSSYTISVDRTGSQYCGLAINWNYEEKYVDISMPGYIHKALHKFQHPTPKKPQYAPHKWTQPTYGAKVQYAAPPTTLPTLDKKRHQKSPVHRRYLPVLYQGSRSYNDCSSE